MNELIIGRKRELAQFESIAASKKSEFVAVYGRRRVGKTFLIKEFFAYKFDFQMTGLANASTDQQLFNFHTTIARQSNKVYPEQPNNWLIAFQRLIDHVEGIKQDRKKIIFIDEMPWFDTPASDFIMGLVHFWNGWALNRKDILLIVCGSAASWMINNLINNHGGLHNRVTQKMKVNAFNLCEAEEMLESKGCVFDRLQIIELYMAMGGIPYYIEAVKPGWSAAQNIQQLFFDEAGLLQNEFFNLYRSLFKKHEVYEKVVETLSTKTSGLNRGEISKLSKIASGGTLTKVLKELEESGFISTYQSLDKKQKNTIYRLSDFYTFFYFKFQQSGEYGSDGSWMNMLDNPMHRVWQGFTYEQICLSHGYQIKKALGIQGILSNELSWRGSIEDKSVQIDLLIDRRDQVINLCEIKFSINKFTIDAQYAENLRNKISVFKQVSKTKKSVFLTLITTYGIENNKYVGGLVQNQITMDDLFAP